MVLPGLFLLVFLFFVTFPFGGVSSFVGLSCIVSSLVARGLLLFLVRSFSVGFWLFSISCFSDPFLFDFLYASLGSIVFQLSDYCHRVICQFI